MDDITYMTANYLLLKGVDANLYRRAKRYVRGITEDDSTRIGQAICESMDSALKSAGYHLSKESFIWTRHPAHAALLDAVKIYQRMLDDDSESGTDCAAYAIGAIDDAIKLFNRESPDVATLEWET